MNDRAYRRLPFAILVFALLVVLSGPISTEKDTAAASGVKAACHSTTACGPEFPSCSAWSSYSDCDAPFCGVAAQCGDCGEIGPCPGPALKQRRERWRVCRGGFSTACIEWQRITVTLDCGC